MKFPITLGVRLDWSEMDLFGHINNVMFFKYVQASRVNYWETIGLTQQFGEYKIGPILASTQCQFLKPLHYPGNITIQARVEFIKNSSFGFHHQILNEQNELTAEAHDVIVWYNFSKNEKVLVSQQAREMIERLENRKFPIDP